jgi:hypothetical protein
LIVAIVLATISSTCRILGIEYSIGFIAAVQPRFDCFRVVFWHRVRRQDLVPTNINVLCIASLASFDRVSQYFAFGAAAPCYKYITFTSTLNLTYGPGRWCTVCRLSVWERAATTVDMEARSDLMRLVAR